VRRTDIFDELPVPQGGPNYASAPVMSPQPLEVGGPRWHRLPRKAFWRAPPSAKRGRGFLAWTPHGQPRHWQRGERSLGSGLLEGPSGSGLLEGPSQVSVMSACTGDGSATSAAGRPDRGELCLQTDGLEPRPGRGGFAEAPPSRGHFDRSQPALPLKRGRAVGGARAESNWNREASSRSTAGTTAAGSSDAP
jgi:hypothetical protein